MGADGQNFNCTRCHSTTRHNIAGRVYTTPASAHRKSLVEDDLAHKITCESCHTDRPHKEAAKMNDHTDKVACQSCHIPTYARVNPTKMSWDWSTAGKKKNGKPYVEKDEFGKPAYVTKKGSFVWGKNVKPQYYWFNGSMEHLTVNDTIDPSTTVALNRPIGNKDDPDSRIFPFKVHMGKQPYDKINKNMVILHLFPKGKDDTAAYWKTYDWDKAIEYGMDYAGLAYSGEYDFVETSYVFPTTHMVAPKDNVVACNECHTRDNSRLANLNGFYMPGRDKSSLLNTVGWILVMGHLVGVGIHGLTRMFTSSRKEGK
jgi:octaheme c-type cytochrome (tetrathionate reductase family)